MGQYYATQTTDCTDDEITIHAPDGRGIAQITFWETVQSQATMYAELIVRAPNASRPLPSLFEQVKQISERSDETLPSEHRM